MGNSAACVGRDFASRARGLDHYIGRLERAYTGHAISQVDLIRVYAGGMLSFGSLLEQAIERLFFGLLTRRLYVNARPSYPRVTVGSPAVARDVVLAGRNYVDWLPYKVTRERAGIFFRDGGPFGALAVAHEQAFEEARIIRNAIAHDSDHALVVFQSKIVGNLRLPPAQRLPVGYLRGQHAGNQNRFNALLARCVRGVSSLST